MPDVEHTEPTTVENSKKHVYTFVVLLEIGAIVILAILIYNTLFPITYWESRELEQNQAKWESQHITHYQMSLSILGYGYESDIMPLTVEVKDNKVVSVVDTKGQRILIGKENPLYYDFPQAFTVPGLFTIAHDWLSKKAPIINVSYDPALGYPEEIYIDPYLEPCCQDFTYSVRDFQVLPP
jgi:hypothetical protein